MSPGPSFPFCKGESDLQGAATGLVGHHFHFFLGAGVFVSDVSTGGDKDALSQGPGIVPCS